MTDDEVWAAGFVDGEGCITIDRHKPRRGDGEHASPQHSLTLSVTNTNLEVLEFLMSMFGGSISRKHKGSSYAQKKIWQWRCASLDAEKAVKKLVPYLKVKKAEAETALDFVELKRATFDERVRNGGPLKDEVIAQREAYRQTLMGLKR